MPYVFENAPRYVFEEPEKKDALKDISPLPEADVSMAAPKAAGAIVGGMQAFPVSGLAGVATGMLEPPEDRSLDISGEPSVGGRFKWDLGRAGRTVEAMGGFPAGIADDKASQELTEELMKPVEMVEHAGKFYGDWVEKNWPDRDEAADMGALTKSIVEGVAFVGLPALKAKLIKSIKSGDMAKVKETLDRVGLEKSPEEMAKSPESKFLKEEFEKRFVFEEAEKPEPIQEPLEPKKVEGAKPQEAVEPVAPKADETVLYSGLPLDKAGKVYTKLVGEPIWDNLIMSKMPKLLEKVPGGKTLNRAFLYEYRGDLKNTEKYISSLDDMKRHQSIGREYGVDLGKRLQSVPEQSQMRIGEAIRGEDVKLTKTESALADESMWAMLELGKQAVDAGLLSEEAFFKNAGRYMPRLYTSKEYQSLLTRFNLGKASRLDLSRFKKRKNIPKEIRKEMGEILTPGYPVAKGISQLTHDIETARFFNGISENVDWSMPKNAEMVPEGWKQLPSNKKLGNLSESYVHPEIFADLQETVRVKDTPEKVWRKALGTWKFGKVIVSPKTHVRNLMSNSVLAHLGGLPMYEQPIFLTKAAKEMKSQGKYWEMMRKEGGGQHTFTAGELNALFDQVEGQMGGIKAGALPEKFGVIGNAWGKSKSAMRKAADLYQAEEQWFKMAKFIHNIESKKKTPKQAWADAEKWLFNYSKVTKFQEKYRSRWYGAPFATFTFKALPRIAEAAVKTPWRFALPGAIIYGLEKVAQRKIGDTPEQAEAKKGLRPEWMQGKFLGIPNFARVPIIDENGREYYLNLTYILPWGDIGESGNFGMIPGGIRPFSQPFVNEPMQQIFNYDPFWEEEIVKETDIAGKPKAEQVATKAKIRGKHIAQTMLPTPVWDVTKVFDSITDRPDYRGRFRPPRVAAADVIAGVKMYPVDYTEQVVKKINKINPNTGYLARKIMGQIRTLAVKKKAVLKRGGDPSLYDRQIAQKIEQLKGLGEEAKEIGELYKKSKGQK